MKVKTNWSVGSQLFEAQALTVQWDKEKALREKKWAFVSVEMEVHHLIVYKA